MGRRAWCTVYTDFSAEAGWRSTQSTAPEPWDDCPEFARLHFALKLIRTDWMHCRHMGMGRDLAGSALKITARCKFWYPLRNIKLRLRAMTRDIKEFAKGRGKQLSIKCLKKSSLHWYLDQCPELHASAYDTAVTISWLAYKPSHLRGPILC